MKTLFDPAVGLMHRLKYPQKFAIISLLHPHLGILAGDLVIFRRFDFITAHFTEFGERTQTADGLDA